MKAEIKKLITFTIEFDGKHCDRDCTEFSIDDYGGPYCSLFGSWIQYENDEPLRCADCMNEVANMQKDPSHEML